MERSQAGGVSAASCAEIGSSRVDRFFGFDRELDGSSELERDMRTSRFQEESIEFLIVLRTRLGFSFESPVIGFLGFDFGSQGFRGYRADNVL